MDLQLYSRIVYSLVTLYMLIILLRWASPILHIELDVGRMAWLKKSTDPVIDAMRKIFPPIGPIDMSPAAVLLVLWFLRTLAMRLFG